MDRNVLILRFRDLVTELGGTIIEHKSLLRSYGEVWWGWWMREHEIPPRQILAELCGEIADNGLVGGYLLDVSRYKIYACSILQIKMAPVKSGMTSPEPEKSPEYYQRGRYPVWFLLNSIEEKEFSSLKLIYDACPSNEVENSKYKSSGAPLLPDGLPSNGEHIKSFYDLRRIDATMWMVKEIIN